MSIHIRTETYECTKCQQGFIAYEKGLPCPACKHPEESGGENYNFIQRMARILEAHKVKYGTFTPPAWYIGSTMDKVQGLYFKFMDDIAANSPSKFLLTLHNLEQADPAIANLPDMQHTADVFFKIYNKYNETAKDPVVL